MHHFTQVGTHVAFSTISVFNFCKVCHKCAQTFFIFQVVPLKLSEDDPSTLEMYELLFVVCVGGGYTTFIRTPKNLYFRSRQIRGNSGKRE